jgi:hypothetical protein
MAFRSGLKLGKHIWAITSAWSLQGQTFTRHGPTPEMPVHLRGAPHVPARKGGAAIRMCSSPLTKVDRTADQRSRVIGGRICRRFSSHCNTDRPARRPQVASSYASKIFLPTLGERRPAAMPSWRLDEPRSHTAGCGPKRTTRFAGCGASVSVEVTGWRWYCRTVQRLRWR